MRKVKSSQEIVGKKDRLVLPSTQKGDGSMNTMADDNIDYQAYVRHNPPAPDKIQRGTVAREERRKAAILKSSVRIDEDILELFQNFVPPGQGLDRWINKALCEWLSARDAKELIRAELPRLIRQAVLATQPGVGLQESEMKKAATSK